MDWQYTVAGAVVCSRPSMVCDFECDSNPAEMQSRPYSTVPRMIIRRLCSTTGGVGLTRRKAALHEKAYQKRIQCRLSQRSLQTHVRPCWCTLTNVHLHLRTSRLESAILNLKTDPRVHLLLQANTHATQQAQQAITGSSLEFGFSPSHGQCSRYYIEARGTGLLRLEEPPGGGSENLAERRAGSLLRSCISRCEMAALRPFFQSCIGK